MNTEVRKMLNSDRHSCHIVVPFELKDGLLRFGVLRNKIFGIPIVLRWIHIQLWTWIWNKYDF